LVTGKKICIIIIIIIISFVIDAAVWVTASVVK
jgi:hypothetical protein